MSGPDDTEDSGRAATLAAWDAVTAADGGAEEAPFPPASEAVTPNVAADGTTDEAPATQEATDKAAEAARARDAHGRFTKQPEAQKPTPTPAPTPGAKVATPAPKPQAQAQTPAPKPQESKGAELKAPGAWSPLAREKWTSLAPEVQQEIHRREKEHSVAAQRAAPYIRTGQAVHEMLAPYEGLMRAQGAEPLQALGAVVQSFATLSIGTSEQKAQVLARLWKSSGITEDALAAAMVGAPPPPGTPQGFDPVQFRQQLLSDIRGMVGQERGQYRAGQAQKEIDAFSQTAEFFEDVREDMGHLQRAAAQAGREMSLEQAYTAALQLPWNNGILEVVKRREAAESAKKKQEEADRAKAVASSVRGQPAGAPPGKQNGAWKDPRDATLAAWDEVMSR